MAYFYTFNVEGELVLRVRAHWSITFLQMCQSLGRGMGCREEIKTLLVFLERLILN
jgi:hypothetical protein